MPKRLLTPPPPDDEPRYLTVVHPFAMNGTCNMELPKNRHDFARWVACCIDKDKFFAIFHKPSSRDMVIIEVNRDYPHFDRILGEHRWSEFIHDPTDDEKVRVTQVFYCTYNTGRIVQKYGWKRIDVEESWFKGWSPRNFKIKFPYPLTHFCDVPVEDRTNNPLCRPLPGAVKEIPAEVIAAPKPVVGSAAWIQTKDAGQPVGQKNAWDKKSQTTLAQPNPTPHASRNANAGVPRPPNTATRRPAIGGGPIVLKSANVWVNSETKHSLPPPVAANWDDIPVSRENTPVSRATQSTSGTASLPSNPPSLVIPTGAGSIAAPASNAGTSYWDSTGTSTSSPESDSGPNLTPAAEYDNPYGVHIHFSDSMEQEFRGMNIRPIDDDDDDDDDDNYLQELDAIAPGVWGNDTNPTWDTAVGGSWDEVPGDYEDQLQQNQGANAPTLCKAHGILCKKGICAEYAKQSRLERRAREAEERKAALANKGKKGSKANRKKDEDEDEDEPQRRKATQNNAFRGPGAPVKRNWRGAPRNIVSADAIEKREANNGWGADEDADGWGKSDSEAETPNVVGVTSGDDDARTEASSDAGWNISEAAFDPWAAEATAVKVVKTTAATRAPAVGRGGGGGGGGGGKQFGKKKPIVAATGPSAKSQTRVAPSSWADQVEAELGGGGDGGGGDDWDKVSVVSSAKGGRGRGSKRRGGPRTT